MGILKNLFRGIPDRKTDTLSEHEKRYLYEYRILPSYAAFQAILFFNPEYEGNEFMSIVAPDEIDTEWGREYFKSVSMKIYTLGGGQMAVIQFPDPQGSPELKCAVVVAKESVFETLKGLEDLNHRPFYIMAKVGDDWQWGEIKSVTVGKDTEYVTEYYRQMSEEDMLGFIKWVVDREGIAGKSDDEMNDPIMQYLRNHCYKTEDVLQKPVSAETNG